MRLREHPKVNWPPKWSGWQKKLQGEREGKLRDVELIEKDQMGPIRLLLACEFKGRVYFAEVICDNSVFIRRLYEKIKSLQGKTIQEIGDLEIED